MKVSDIPQFLLDDVRQGTVIPAHPLALNDDGTFNEKYQIALARYYCAAGAGGLAVGVHSTQFEIRDPQFDLFEPVLSLASKTIDAASEERGRPMLKVAGVCGKTAQARQEAELARDLGYHAVLLSLGAMADEDLDSMLRHCQEISEVMPLIGFYLQPAVGGRILPYAFWRKFMEIENVLAVKMAPFNRYQTFDVVRALSDAKAEGRITLYTGNDDNILSDLMTTYRMHRDGEPVNIQIKGGLLGHWAVWTRKAVELMDEVKSWRQNGLPAAEEVLTRSIEITDSNAAFFDAANAFHGCIPGIHEVLRRQGLMPSTRCLNPKENLSPGQSEEIDRVYQWYPYLNDDAFVQEHLDHWLRG